MAKGKYHDWLTTDGLLKLKSYARDGLNDKEIAAKIGITQETFYQWIKRFSEFSESIKKGREPINTIVEDTFFNEKLQSRTIKEKTVEKTIHRDADGNITGSSEHIKETERFIPADTTAMLFYMKCRMPEKYNDKLNVTVEDNRNGQLADLIEGLKEDDIYTETETSDEDVADEQAETNKSS